MEPKFVKIDSGEYESASTVDRTPREPRQLPFKKKDVTGAEIDMAERLYKVEVQLKITPVGEKGVSIPVLNGTYPGSRVMDSIAIAVRARRTEAIIYATLGKVPAEIENRTGGQPGALIEERF